MTHSNETAGVEASAALGQSELTGFVMRKYYTKLETLNQMGYLKSQTPKDGYKFKFSLFFQPSDDRIHLINHGKLVLFITSYGLIASGNLDCITSEYKELSFRQFTDTVTIGA